MTSASSFVSAPISSDTIAFSSADLRRRAEVRLRRVCIDWPADRFAVLIADVVRFHERWDVPARHA